MTILTPAFFFSNFPKKWKNPPPLPISTPYFPLIISHSSKLALLISSTMAKDKTQTTAKDNTKRVGGGRKQSSRVESGPVGKKNKDKYAPKKLSLKIAPNQQKKQNKAKAVKKAAKVSGQKVKQFFKGCGTTKIRKAISTTESSISHYGSLPQDDKTTEILTRLQTKLQGLRDELAAAELQNTQIRALNTDSRRNAITHDVKCIRTHAAAAKLKLNLMICGEEITPQEVYYREKVELAAKQKLYVTKFPGLERYISLFAKNLSPAQIKKREQIMEQILKENNYTPKSDRLVANTGGTVRVLSRECLAEAEKQNEKKKEKKERAGGIQFIDEFANKDVWGSSDSGSDFGSDSD
jgi:hypothetical protein